MNTLSLTDTLKMHAALGRYGFAPKMVGEIDAVVRNQDGSIDQRIKQHNLFTHLYGDTNGWIAAGNQMVSAWIFISNDDSDMLALKTVFRSTYANTMTSSTTTIKNGAAKTWTFQNTFAAPTAPGRTINVIGLAYADYTRVGSYACALAGAYCATKLTSPITQSNTQTLEITYRVTIMRG
jgi:hypothetical protein